MLHQHNSTGLNYGFILNTTNASDTNAQVVWIRNLYEMSLWNMDLNVHNVFMFLQSKSFFSMIFWSLNDFTGQAYDVE